MLFSLHYSPLHSCNFLNNLLVTTINTKTLDKIFDGYIYASQINPFILSQTYICFDS